MDLAAPSAVIRKCSPLVSEVPTPVIAHTNLLYGCINFCRMYVVVARIPGNFFTFCVLRSLFLEFTIGEVQDSLSKSPLLAFLLCISMSSCPRTCSRVTVFETLG